MTTDPEGDERPAWAEVLRVQARRLGLTGREIAVRCGVHEAVAGRWLSGQREPADYATLLRVLKLPRTWPPTAATMPPLREQYQVGDRRQHRAWIAGLSEREREVYELRVIADEPLTLAALAERWGVSRAMSFKVDARVRAKHAAAVKLAKHGG